MYMYVHFEIACLKVEAWRWSQLDIQLSMQSVPITTDVVGSTPAQGEVYNIMW
jgi:hypothetical protein